MGYYSELAIELLEGRCDRELLDLDDIFEETVDKPASNHNSTIEQQEEQCSTWSKNYRRQLEQHTISEANSQKQYKVYQKNKRQ